MAWLKKKDKIEVPKKGNTSISYEAYPVEDEPDFAYNNYVKQNAMGNQQKTQQPMQPIQRQPIQPQYQAQEEQEDEVIPFVMQQREGLIKKGSKEIIAESVWEVFAEILNRLDRIEKALKE